MSPYVQIIAPSIEIGTQWKEIKIDPSLKVVKKIQSVYIEVPEIPKWDFEMDTDTNNNYFIDPQGKQIKIEMQLISKDGQIFTMNSIHLGPGLGFSYIPKGKDLVNESRFPHDVIFDKMRVRSNQVFKGGQVKWSCYSRK